MSRQLCQLVIVTAFLAAIYVGSVTCKTCSDCNRLTRFDQKWEEVLFERLEIVMSQFMHIFGNWGMKIYKIAILIHW